MKELIVVAQRKIGEDTVRAVNARDLHTFLDVGKDFSTWIKNRIDQYAFAENQDFVVFAAGPQIGGAGNRGARIEYAITLDMAKELAMVERNEKGKQARQYFIECERRANAVQQFSIPQTLPEALRLAADLADENKLLGQKIVADAPKVEVYARIADAQGSLCLRDAAKALQQQPGRFNDFLQREKWIYRRLGHKSLIGYQDKVQAGYLTHKVTPYLDSVTGEDKISEQVRITPKGLAKLAMMLDVTPQIDGEAA